MFDSTKNNVLVPVFFMHNVAFDVFSFVCLFLQAYTEVPSTPLHTAAVLREEEENWQDVKVRDSSMRQGHKLTLNFSVMSCWQETLQERKMFFSEKNRPLTSIKKQGLLNVGDLVSL